MATWFKFTKDFDFTPRPNVDIAYRAGQTVYIPDPHAEAAEKAKAGERVERGEVKPDARRRNA